ncbi:glycosyl hydrolase family 3 C-terminal domain-containing protein [Scheffersomyces amazonensis]|uniref:glycosyl hydrolase family 3 C-terminal domain-containing protein n=1 Tax=Scheffersomyces amazonensis TaxID=1078765 RepID=UPI00315CD7B9
MQDEGVVATARHLIGYEQEHFRQVGEWEENGWDCLESAISSNIGDRAMHEIYLWPFADLVRAGVGSVMCSFNKVNNTYACQNSYLINYLLKEELGFQGFVLSDWGAQHSGVYSALAGLDMTMPGEISDEWLTGKSYWGPLLTRAVYNGTLSQDRLNDMAMRILAPFFSIDTISLPTEEDEPNFSSCTFHTYGQEFAYQHFGPIVQKNWHQDSRSEFSDITALSVARESIVLLKNDGHNLPIAKIDGVRRIFIAGIAAGPDPKGFNCKDKRCVDGVLTSGWGSSAVNDPFVITPYEAISKLAREQGMVVDYSNDAWELDHVQELADYADLSIVVVSADSGEGYIEVDENFGDRKNLSLWHNGDKLIETVAEKCRKTIVVVNSVGPVNMEKWIENENVVGVLYAPPLGQFVGQAIAEILFGVINPSGKLPFTIARKKQHYVPIIDELNGEKHPQDNFDRDIYLDYRFFDKHNIKPRFEFGFGLSYSKFKLCNLRIDEINSPTEYLPYPEEYLPIYKTVEDDVCDPEDALFPHDEFEAVPGYIYPYLYNENVRSIDDGETFEYPAGYNPDQPIAPPLSGGGLGGNPDLWQVYYNVSVEVKNEGKHKGGYVGQLYIELPSTIVPSPPKILRGFEKVFLEPGESAILSFSITHRDLSIWDTYSQQWIIQTGTYKIYVSNSSRKVDLSGEIDIGC